MVPYGPGCSKKDCAAETIVVDGLKIETCGINAASVIGLKLTESFPVKPDGEYTSDNVGVSDTVEALKCSGATGVGATGSESGSARKCSGSEAATSEVTIDPSGVVDVDTVCVVSKEPCK